MKAEEIKHGEWFMTKESKWYKKIGEEGDFVLGSQIGILTTFKIPKNDEVTRRKEK